MPRRFEARLETSVYRTTELSDVELWQICETYYEKLANLTAKGRGDGSAQSVLDAGLSFDPNGVPHPRHADIVGWHEATNMEDKEMKHHWMNAARKFAGEFSFKARPQ